MFSVGVGVKVKVVLGIGVRLSVCGRAQGKGQDTC